MVGEGQHTDLHGTEKKVKKILDMLPLGETNSNFLLTDQHIRRTFLRKAEILKKWSIPCSDAGSRNCPPVVPKHLPLSVGPDNVSRSWKDLGPDNSDRRSASVGSQSR